MILQALARHYETLCDLDKVERPGWDKAFKVSYGLELNDEGELIQLIPLMTEETRGKKTMLVPRAMKVPAHVGKSSNIQVNFLCDNCVYLLGNGEKKGENDRKSHREWALKRFHAEASFHQKLLCGVDSPAARAILAFFEHWNPDEAPNHPILKEKWDAITENVNLIFTYNMQSTAEDRAIIAAWQSYYDQEDPCSVIGQCLISGETAPLAAKHPLIKGVHDAPVFGSALVSFNGSAFCSYGHVQNFNAPISTRSAFAYTTALNYLLSDREHCRTMGDATVVCWAEHGDAAYQDAWMAEVFGDDEGVSDAMLIDMLDKVTHGQTYDWKGVKLRPDEHFYVLGLSPNAARLSVRFFLRDSFDEFMRNIEKHYRDTSIVRPKFDKDENVPLWKLLQETVNQKSKDKTASPQMAGDSLRAILTGTPYPATLINATHLRIRAEQKVSRGRAAILKGFYRRSSNPTIHEEVFCMDLNETSNYIPYVLGRLFSVLEDLQEAANPGINTTIRDKYFNSASATPASVFPLLINLAQKHLHKLKEGQKVSFNMQITELIGRLPNLFPARLTLQEQGAFQIGYYHQTQRRFTKKEEKENV